MKKRKYKLFAYLLSLSMSLTGCNALNKDNVSNGEIINSLYETSLESDEAIESIEEDVQEVVEEIIPLDPLIEEYINYYETDTNYYIKDYFESSLNPTFNKIDCIYTGTLEASEIANIIKENSKDVPTSCSNFFASDMNLNIITNILEDIKNNSTNNVTEDLHTISTLKIYYKDYKDFITLSNEDTTLAYYNEETNTLIVNRFNIRTMADIESRLYNEVLKQILEHEFNHIRQDKCPCRAFDINNFEYSPSSMTFIKESSAESELYNVKDINYIDYGIYQFEREYETELFLLALLNDKEVEDYYNAIFDTNEKMLCDFFSLKTPEEVGEFNNILYQMDALLYRNSYSVFGETKDLADYELSIGYNYKIEIFKNCIIDLLEKTNNESISLEENLTIFNVIKNILIKNAYTYQEDNEHFKMVTDKKFIEEFMLLEEKYIEFLSVYYGVSVSEIRDLENLEIKCIIVNMNNSVNNKELINYKDEEALLILNKYPLLENILNSNYIYQSDYEVYLEDFNYKLKK